MAIMRCSAGLRQELDDRRQMLKAIEGAREALKAPRVARQ